VDCQRTGGRPRESLPLLPIEPEEGFEISLWYRVELRARGQVCNELDRLYAKPNYRHPRGRWCFQ